MQSRLNDRGKTIFSRLVTSLPKFLARLGYALANRGADVAWLHQRLRPSKRGVGQLEANLYTLTGNSDVRGLSREGMRSYMRYFYEAFALAGVQPEQLRHRVRVEGDFEALKADEPGPMWCLHYRTAGNWDLAGAWASQELATVLTVAEKVEPPQLFEKFIEFRQGLGMEIIAQAPGQKVFEQLVQKAQQGHYFIPLLADRDLSAAGIEVDFGWPTSPGSCRSGRGWRPVPTHRCGSGAIRLWNGLEANAVA